MRLVPALARLDRPLRVMACGLAAVGATQVWRAIATDDLKAEAGRQIMDLGGWGPPAFGVGFVVAALLLAPCVALMLAAGAAFGPWLGAITLSVASTAAAAIAFLLARGVARRRIRALVASDHRLSTLDRAVEQSGWRMVALLRLSLIVPFGLSNYALGVCSLRFIPYLLTSWFAMLPACLLYGWLGHLGARGLDVVLTHEQPWTWAALGLGLLGTVATTLWLTRLIRGVSTPVRAGAADAS